MKHFLKLTIEVEIDETYYSMDDEEKEWMDSEILTGGGDLILHSNEIGDSIGIVKKVSNIKWKHVKEP